MKVVINRCFGGFGLSSEAMMLYATKKGIDLYPETHPRYPSLGVVFYYLAPKEQVEEARQRDQENNTHKESNALMLSDYDIERTDPALVEVVEELRDRANGKFADLHIVDIPENVNYEIMDYDGMESIHEIHRVWS